MQHSTKFSETAVNDFDTLIKQRRELFNYPTVTPITLVPNYRRTIREMLEAGHYEGKITSAFNDVNFPVEPRGYEREFVLINFQRGQWSRIGDSIKPRESELLRELDKMGLEPEGAAEFCAFGEQHPDVARKASITARRQFCWDGVRTDWDGDIIKDPRGSAVCPIMCSWPNGPSMLDAREVHLNCIRMGWVGDTFFLCSRKPNSK
jgi:hypothetical protein